MAAPLFAAVAHTLLVDASMSARSRQPYCPVDDM
jgi:hypothetical protein